MLRIYLSILISAILPIIIWIDIWQPESIYHLGLLSGLLSVLLMTWQHILGFRLISTRIFGSDLISINSIHKQTGRIAAATILLHVGILVLYYSNLGVTLIDIFQFTNFDIGITFGLIAFFSISIMLFVTLALKNTLPFRIWKRFHLLGYVALPMAIVHSLIISPTIRNSELLRSYWTIIALVYTIVLLVRLLSQFGFLKRKYQVASILEMTPTVKTIRLKPLSKPIIPQIGQFVYLQIAKFGENHPFTASGFTAETGEIEISVKKFGKFTADVHGLKVGDIIQVDGPYGTFVGSQSHIETLVLLVGGIGITPFMRLLRENRSSRMILFYGNKTESEIAFEKELADLDREENIEVVNVVQSASDNWKGAKGFITTELIKSRIGDKFGDATYLVCGPPVMISLIEKNLRAEGILKEKIISEKFSL